MKAGAQDLLVLRSQASGEGGCVTAEGYSAVTWLMSKVSSSITAYKLDGVTFELELLSEVRPESFRSLSGIRLRPVWSPSGVRPPAS